MLVAFVSVWQTQATTLYDQYDVQANPAHFTLDFMQRDIVLLRNVVTFNFLFYSCLWTVKLSFLFFFRRLGSKVRGIQVWWWVVLVVTGLTWVASVADIDYQCALSDYMYIVTKCPTLERVHFQNRTFYANCAADVLTDILIVSIPVLMLWRVRIPLKQKLLLMAIFSVTVVIMAVAIIRVAVVHENDQNADISWLYLWSGLEAATACIIACVASFRQLFTSAAQQKPQHKAAASPQGSSQRGLLSYFRGKGYGRKFSSFFSSNGSSGTHDRPEHLALQKQDSWGTDDSTPPRTRAYDEERALGFAPGAEKQGHLCVSCQRLCANCQRAMRPHGL